MRKAAFKAGLIQDESSDRLALALEPEAACVACEAENEALREGHRFMVLDCGGGTVDITMHRVVEKQPRMQLDEMCRPSGGPWGSTFVDSEFGAFIKDLVGAASFGRLKASSQWVELMRVWEGVKLGFDPSQDLSGENCKSVNLSSVLEVSARARCSAFIPVCWAFNSIWLRSAQVEDSSVTLSALVDAYNQKRGAGLRVRGRNGLLLPSAMICKFFHGAISKTIGHVKELLAVQLLTPTSALAPPVTFPRREHSPRCAGRNQGGHTPLVRNQLNHGAVPRVGRRSTLWISSS